MFAFFYNILPKLIIPINILIHIIKKKKKRYWKSEQCCKLFLHATITLQFVWRNSVFQCINKCLMNLNRFCLLFVSFQKIEFSFHRTRCVEQQHSRTKFIEFILNNGRITKLIVSTCYQSSYLYSCIFFHLSVERKTSK